MMIDVAQHSNPLNHVRALPFVQAILITPRPASGDPLPWVWFATHYQHGQMQLVRGDDQWPEVIDWNEAKRRVNAEEGTDYQT
jgi:hypothetical protein